VRARVSLWPQLAQCLTVYVVPRLSQRLLTAWLGLDASWVFAAVGLSCFGGGDGDGAKDETAATERAAAAAERAAAAEQPPLLLALPGGVEVRGEAGRLEVSLFDAEGKAVRLRRAWAGGEVSSEVSSEVE